MPRMASFEGGCVPKRRRTLTRSIRTGGAVPPSSIHLNGGVNLSGGEEVFRELGSRIGDLASAYPDGETGDRSYWIWFQLARLQAAGGLVEAPHRTDFLRGDTIPQVRLAEGVDPDDVDFGNLGYADDYVASYELFKRMRDEGAIPEGVRFQIQYPTPRAVITVFVDKSQIDRLLIPYERAMFADLDRLMASLPHDDIQVQWDVSIEIGIIEDADWYHFGPDRDRDMTPSVARAVDAVPDDVPVGLHLCYGNYKHAHESEPETLQVQVDLLRETIAASKRRLNYASLTVPQYQDSASYFAPLVDLPDDALDRVYFGIVPYHPDSQAPGTTERQIVQIDRYLDKWGICTECGMSRPEPGEIPRLLDLHREIVQKGAPQL